MNIALYYIGKLIHFWDPSSYGGIINSVVRGLVYRCYSDQLKWLMPVFKCVSIRSGLSPYWCLFIT